MTVIHLFSLPLIVELVGAMIFLLIFFKFVGKATGATASGQKIIWKLALVGFIIMAFISINTLMFQFEFAREAKMAQAIRDFNQSKTSIEIVGVETSKSAGFAYETDRKQIHFLVKDISTNETVPCYLSRDHVFVYFNETVAKPFIIFNSTENTIDLHLPAEAREIRVDQIVEEEVQSTELKSEALFLFLTSAEVLE